VRQHTHSAEALHRAQTSSSVINEQIVIAAFCQRGIAPEQIVPRVNVLTYDAWLAMGRQVRKGEHGVHVWTYITGTRTETDAETGETRKAGFRKPKRVAVFHISQTDPARERVQ